MSITTTKKGRKTYYTNSEGLLAERVTSIIGQLDKPALIWWGIDCALDKVEELLDTLNGKPDSAFIERMRRMARVARFKVSKTALDVGSTVHSIAEGIIKGEDIDISSYGEQVRNGAQSFIDWYGESAIEPLYIEEPILYKEDIEGIGVRGFGGRPDLICMDGGKVAIYDWKTSKGFYEPSMPLQLGAYKLAANQLRDNGELEELPEPISNGAIGRMDKLTGEFELKEYTAEELDKYGQAFLELFRYNAKIKEAK